MVLKCKVAPGNKVRVSHHVPAAAIPCRSCEPVRLTEEDTEYNISCTKHVFDEHVVLQFDCTNTIAEQVRKPSALMSVGVIAHDGLLPNYFALVGKAELCPFFFSSLPSSKLQVLEEVLAGVTLITAALTY